MAFSVNKFNNSNHQYDVAENLGKLTFMGYREGFEFVDGERVETATHVEAFSEKLNDVIPLKLPDGSVKEDVPFMQEIEVTGKASLWIYDFEAEVTRGENTYTTTNYGFSLRIDGFKKVGQQQSKPSPQKEEVKN